MHDVAGAAAENSVKLILARSGETGVSAIFQTRKAVAKIPAPGPLADVARERSSVANLRRADLLGGFGQHRIFFANALIVAQSVERDQAADFDFAALVLYLIQALDRFADSPARPGETRCSFTMPSKIAAAAHDGSVRPLLCAWLSIDTAFAGPADLRC